MSQITIQATTVSDPELRVTANSSTVTTLRCAVNKRKLDKNTNEWVDVNTTFYTLTVWSNGKNMFAENVNSSIRKGMKIIAMGDFQTRAYTKKDGTEGVVNEILVDSLGPDLRYNTADVVKSTSQTGQQTQIFQPAQIAPTNAVANDPWANAGADAEYSIDDLPF